MSGLRLTPEERRIRAKIAAHARHAKYPTDAAVAAMREGLWRKYHTQVDPNNELEPAERDRRARQAMRADLARRALDAAKARRQRADDQLVDALLQEVPA